MSRAIDKLVILALSLTVLALLWKLLAKEGEAAAPEKRHEDKLNLAEWPERQQQYEREIRMER